MEQGYESLQRGTHSVAPRMAEAKAHGSVDMARDALVEAEEAKTKDLHRMVAEMVHERYAGRRIPAVEVMLVYTAAVEVGLAKADASSVAFAGTPIHRGRWMAAAYAVLKAPQILECTGSLAEARQLGTSHLVLNALKNS